MYSTERRRLWLDAPFVNDLGRYWYRSIAQILSPVHVWGNAVCLIWSRHPKAMHRKLFGINRFSWWNPVTMWLCIGVVQFLSNKMWTLNWIKLWKIHENPSRVVACLSMCDRISRHGVDLIIPSDGCRALLVNHTLGWHYRQSIASSYLFASISPMPSTRYWILHRRLNRMLWWVHS